MKRLLNWLKRRREAEYQRGYDAGYKAAQSKMFVIRAGDSQIVCSREIAYKIARETPADASYISPLFVGDPMFHVRGIQP